MKPAEKLHETLIRAARASDSSQPRATGFEQRVLAALVVALTVGYTLAAPGDLLAAQDALVQSALFGWNP
jgi:hypothetical protein